MSREYVLQPFRAQVELNIDYARELNEQQCAAVTAPPGPALVIAGAGSGKTRTLIYRVAFLLEQGIPAERILLLTFTNKAAREMMRRVADLLGQELSALWGGTFHSIGNRILRQHAERIGYKRDFTILDREDAEHLIRACLGDSNIETTQTLFPKPGMLADIFSLSLNTERPISLILDSQYERFAAASDQIEELARAYRARKLASNCIDFDDLLVLWLKLLQEHDDVREQYQRRFQFILVDEYQDTNKLQSDIIDLLAARHKNLMVVGDDAQSIYAWRGANYANILEFPRRYENAHIYKIETNYRSTPQILEVANAAIRPNLHQFTKELAPSRTGGDRPALVACNDAAEQAVFVSQRVLQLRDEGVSLNRMAVLYRSHFHALELQLELTRRNIPFTITSGIRFFEQAHIKDVTAYLKIVSNPRDELSFKRLVQLLPGIAGRGAEKLWLLYVEKLDNVETSSAGSQEGTANATSRNPVAQALQACASAVGKKTKVAWAQFVATLSQLESYKIRNNPARMIKVVIDAGYDKYLKANYANQRTRLDDLEQLAIFSQQFPSLQEFLTQLALLTSIEADEERPNQDDELLRLSTVHQAKGLEFDVVFVIMLCDGLFPSARAVELRDGEEEERRLFYVAITRARNDLYLSYPLVRAGFGTAGDSIQRPSRFLSDIPRELVEEWSLRRYY